jgi:hypothetical protein
MPFFLFFSTHNYFLTSHCCGRVAKDIPKASVGYGATLSSTNYLLCYLTKLFIFPPQRAPAKTIIIQLLKET